MRRKGGVKNFFIHTPESKITEKQHKYFTLFLVLDILKFLNNNNYKNKMTVVFFTKSTNQTFFIKIK